MKNIAEEEKMGVLKKNVEMQRDTGIPIDWNSLKQKFALFLDDTIVQKQLRLPIGRVITPIDWNSSGLCLVNDGE